MWNRPIDRWINGVILRELDDLGFNPKHIKKITKNSNLGDSNLIKASPAFESWLSPLFPGANNFVSPQLMSSNLNEKGDLVLKAKLPYGLNNDDIQLNFDESGLTLNASKSHEEEKQIHGNKGISKHTTNISVSHHWPLDHHIKPEDIEASWNDQDGLLEIIVTSWNKKDASKSTKINIQNHRRIEEPKPRGDGL